MSLPDSGSENSSDKLIQHFDVVIIGSGISALTSAILLAQKGKSVAVLEQAAKPGGYMHGFRRFGELYDTGAHYAGALGPKQPFRVLLEYLKVYRENLFIELESSGFDVFRFPEGEIQFPQGYDNVISELSASFPQEKPAIRTYFELVRSIVRYFPTYEFSDETLDVAPAEAFEVSLASVVEKITANRQLQTVLYAYCNLHGVYPKDVAFGFHAIVTDSLLRGAYGLAAGGDALAKAFVEQIERLNGKVFLKHRVSCLEVDARNIKRVKTENGAVFESEWVISSIHPKQTLRLLSDQTAFTPAFLERTQSLSESTGIFGVYAATEKRPQIDPLRNYYYFRSSDPLALFHEKNFDEEPNVVFMTSPKRTWTDSTTKFPLCLHSAGPSHWFSEWQNEIYGKRSPDYVAFKARYAEQMLSLVDRYQPGLSSTFQSWVSSSSLTNLHFNGSEEGSSYGIYHSIQNTGPRALGPRTKILNLLLTGQNCLFPGLMGAAVSALRTCGHIVGIKSVLAELKENGKHL